MGWDLISAELGRTKKGKGRGESATKGSGAKGSDSREKGDAKAKGGKGKYKGGQHKGGGCLTCLFVISGFLVERLKPASALNWPHIREALRQFSERICTQTYPKTAKERNKRTSTICLEP